MSPSVPDHLLEAALHAAVTQRCERAYLHEVRNSLQGIYAGMDAFGRLLDGKTGSVSADRIKQVARNAVQSHERSLAETMQHAVWHQAEPGTVDASSELRHVARFLRNDGMRNGVAIEMADSAPYPVHVRPSALRLTLLTLTVCAIDAMSGGELLLSARVQEGIRFELRAPQAGSWNVDDWRFAALKKIVAADAGELHLDAAAAVLRYQPIAN